MSRLLTPAAVADVLAVSSRTVRRMLDAGDLPALRVGKLWRVDPDRLAEWQRARETGNPERGQGASAPVLASVARSATSAPLPLASLPSDYTPVFGPLGTVATAAASPAAGRTRSAKRNRKPA